MAFDWTIKISLILSVITLIINLWIYSKNRKTTLENQKIQFLSVLRQYQSDLREWADLVIIKMTETAYMCDLDPKKDNQFYSKRHSLRISLSSLLDSGRMFLPNEDKERYGSNKELAYRGFRKLSLDLVKECHDYSGRLNYENQTENLDLRKEIIDCKRRFISEITRELNPELYVEKVTKKLKELVNRK